MAEVCEVERSNTFDYVCIFVTSFSAPASCLFIAMLRTYVVCMCLHVSGLGCSVDCFLFLLFVQGEADKCLLSERVETNTRHTIVQLDPSENNAECAASHEINQPLAFENIIVLAQH